MPFELQIDLRIVFRYDATTTQVQDWRRCFEIAAKVLYHATDGQFRLNELDVINNGGKDKKANAYIYPYAGTSETGSKIYIKDDEKLKPHTIVHELGHFLFDLGDEYKKRPNGTYERRCRTDPTTGRCLMEFGASDGVHINQTGDVVQGPVQYFCYAEHDPDRDTEQQIRRRMSCWDWIKVVHPGVTIPTGTISTQLAGEDLPTWTLTQYAKWQVVFLDGTPSVNNTAAMSGLKSGLRLWADLLSVSSAGDRFAIVAAATNPVLVPLIQLEQDSDIDAIQQQIDDFEFEAGAGDFAAALASLNTLQTGRPAPSNPELTLLSFGPTPTNASLPDPAPNTGHIYLHTFAASVGGVVGKMFQASNNNNSEFRATDTPLDKASVKFDTLAEITELATTLLTDAELVLFHRTNEHESLDPSSESGSYSFELAPGASELICVIVLDRPIARDFDWDLQPAGDSGETRTGEDYLVRVISDPTPGRWTLTLQQAPEFQLMVAARNPQLDVELEVRQDARHSVRVTAFVESPELALGLDAELFILRADGTGEPQQVTMRISEQQVWQYEATVALADPGLYTLEARFRNVGEAIPYDRPPPDEKEYTLIPVPNFQRVVRKDFVID